MATEQPVSWRTGDLRDRDPRGRDLAVRRPGAWAGGWAWLHGFGHDHETGEKRRGGWVFTSREAPHADRIFAGWFRSHQAAMIEAAVRFGRAADESRKITGQSINCDAGG